MAVQLDSAFNYNDLQGLDVLKQGARKDDPAALRAVAQQFESMFMNMIMSSMRDATDVLASDLESSYQTDFYRDMYDQQLSLTLSQQGGFGLADVLYRQLGGEQLENQKDLNEMEIKPLGDISSRIDALNYEQSLSSRAKTEELETPVSDEIIATSSISSIIPKTEFNTPKQFIESLMPMAKQAAKVIGVDPKILVAQAALETGWGESLIKTSDGQSANNFFGIKANSQWKGQSAETTTHEYYDGKRLTIKDSFRAYENAEQSFNDYVEFVTNNERYQPALAVATDSKAYVQALQNAGYATDPNYAQKIIRISQSEWFDHA